MWLPAVVPKSVVGSLLPSNAEPTQGSYKPVSRELHGPLRPGMGQCSQAFEVDLGIDFRCVKRPVAKDLCDFPHRRPRAQHGSCQAVTKQVGSFKFGV